VAGPPVAHQHRAHRTKSPTGSALRHLRVSAARYVLSAARTAFQRGAHPRGYASPVSDAPQRLQASTARPLGKRRLRRSLTGSRSRRPYGKPRCRRVVSRRSVDARVRAAGVEPVAPRHARRVAPGCSRPHPRASRAAVSTVAYAQRALASASVMALRAAEPRVAAGRAAAHGRRRRALSSSAAGAA
jgi:hypothetical protein